MNDIKEKLREIAKKISVLETEANALVKGNQLTVITKWNGQPWGSSKKARTGETFKVTSCHIDGTSIWVFVEGECCSMSLSDFEFVPTPPADGVK